MLENNPSLVKKLKRTSARWNPLRKVDTLGQFDFATGIVMFDSLKSHSVKGITLNDAKSEKSIDLLTYQHLAKILPLAIHEYTHFIDCTSTLWGLRHLRILHRAYTCDTTDENKFHVMRTCYTHLKRIKLPDYYTTTNEGCDTSRPWQWRPTSGREFRHDGRPSERPIFFIRFFNETWEPIARSPISAISLLETCAMAAELKAHSSLLLRIQDDAQRKIQTTIFERETLEYLYNPELTEYSVCAHLVANTFNCKDGIQAFWGSSIIARTALNSSEEVYRTVLQNIKTFLNSVRLQYTQTEAKAIRRGLENRDPGVLFYVICLSMKRGSLESKAEFAQSLIEAMLKLGVHLVKKHETTMIKEGEAILNEIKHSPIKTLARLSEAGFDNLKAMLGKFGTFDIDTMNLPPALLGDDSAYHFHDTPTNKLNKFDIEESFFEMLKGQVQMENFGDACI